MTERKNIEKVVGSVIREMREVRNLSQEKLAELGDFERSYISKVETGIRSVRFTTIIRFAHALDVKPSELVAKIETKLDM